MMQSPSDDAPIDGFATTNRSISMRPIRGSTACRYVHRQLQQEDTASVLRSISCEARSPMSPADTPGGGHTPAAASPLGIGGPSGGTTPRAGAPGLASGGTTPGGTHRRSSVGFFAATCNEDEWAEAFARGGLAYLQETLRGKSLDMSMSAGPLLQATAAVVIQAMARRVAAAARVAKMKLRIQVMIDARTASEKAELDSLRAEISERLDAFAASDTAVAAASRIQAFARRELARKQRIRRGPLVERQLCLKAYNDQRVMNETKAIPYELKQCSAKAHVNHKFKDRTVSTVSRHDIAANTIQSAARACVVRRRAKASVRTAVNERRIPLRAYNDRRVEEEKTTTANDDVGGIRNEGEGTGTVPPGAVITGPLMAQFEGRAVTDATRHELAAKTIQAAVRLSLARRNAGTLRSTEGGQRKARLDAYNEKRIMTESIAWTVPEPRPEPSPEPSPSDLDAVSGNKTTDADTDAPPTPGMGGTVSQSMDAPNESMSQTQTPKKMTDRRTVAALRIQTFVRRVLFAAKTSAQVAVQREMIEEAIECRIEEENTPPFDPATEMGAAAADNDDETATSPAAAQQDHEQKKTEGAGSKEDTAGKPTPIALDGSALSVVFEDAIAVAAVLRAGGGAAGGEAVDFAASPPPSQSRHANSTPPPGPQPSSGPAGTPSPDKLKEVRLTGAPADSGWWLWGMQALHAAAMESRQRDPLRYPNLVEREWAPSLAECAVETQQLAAASDTARHMRTKEATEAAQARADIQNAAAGVTTPHAPTSRPSSQGTAPRPTSGGNLNDTTASGYQSPAQRIGSAIATSPTTQALAGSTGKAPPLRGSLDRGMLDTALQHFTTEVAGVKDRAVERQRDRDARAFRPSLKGPVSPQISGPSSGRLHRGSVIAAHAPAQPSTGRPSLHGSGQGTTGMEVVSGLGLSGSKAQFSTRKSVHDSVSPVRPMGGLVVAPSPPKEGSPNGARGSVGARGSRAGLQGSMAFKGPTAGTRGVRSGSVPRVERPVDEGLAARDEYVKAIVKQHDMKQRLSKVSGPGLRR